MDTRNINDINTLINDVTQYKGEIFVNISNSGTFDSVKSFLDSNNLIAFIPSYNTIYAQQHKYIGLTDEQIASFSTFASNITELQNKLHIVDSDNPTDHDNQSIIGTLTYGEGNDKISASNITQFVISVLERIEAGDSAIATDLAAINEKLAGINGTVKDYVDNNISDLASLIASVNAMVARGDYATRVTAENNDPFIEVELTATSEVNDGVTSMVPPYTYKVKSKDTIASKTDLQQLEATLQSKIAEEVGKILGEGNIDETLDTIKEISDWILNHPDATQIINDIDLLKEKVNEILGEITEEVEDPDTHETVIRPKKFSTGLLSGQNYAQSIEEMNLLLNNTINSIKTEMDNKLTWLII